MKISDTELRQLVREAVRKKMSLIKEGSDFSARRQIVSSAESASMDFERQIVSILNIVEPDELPPGLQEQYLLIVEAMKKKVVAAVKDATRELARLPKKESQSKKK